MPDIPGVAPLKMNGIPGEPAEDPASANHSIFYQLDILAKDGLTPIFLGDHQGAVAEMPGTKLGGLLTIPVLQ